MGGTRTFLQVRPIGAATQESHSLWRSILASTDLPILVALLCDSLLTARAETGVDHAARTVIAYTELGANDSIDNLHRALGIARANTIARRRRMPVEEGVRQGAFGFAASAISGHMPDGVAARLATIPLSVAPADLHDGRRRTCTDSVPLLDQAATEYRDPSSADWIADCRRNLATTDSERLEATRLRIDMYLATASQRTSALGGCTGRPQRPTSPVATAIQSRATEPSG